jgi:hypothetical protein
VKVRAASGGIYKCIHGPRVWELRGTADGQNGNQEIGIGRLLIAELNEETSNHITKKNHKFPNMLMGFL